MSQYEVMAQPLNPLEACRWCGQAPEWHRADGTCYTIEDVLRWVAQVWREREQA